LEIWKIILYYIGDAIQYTDDSWFGIPNAIRFHLCLLSPTSKYFDKICREIYQHLRENSSFSFDELEKPPTKELCSYFAQRGYLSLLQLAHARGCSWDSTTCYAAAENGHLACLKFAHENGCEWDDGVTSAAAGSSLSCLIYARENGCPWEQYATWLAANSGSIERLRYLHENGCEWHVSACDAAAETSMECLIYAHEHGCNWTSEACTNAASGNQLAILQYLVANGCRT
jgi:hypothetical protein